jgi:protein-S-isoprenylcysteine O-methyltransferase Ste14
MELVKEFDKQGNFLFKYRGTLPILILFLGLSVQAYFTWKHSHANMSDFKSNEYEFICLGVALIGLIVRILSVGYAQKNTSGRNTEQQVADHLNTSGMYSIMRHPLYVGNFFMWLGVAMLTGHTWFIIAFVLAYWIYYERIMYAEEVFIARKFGPKFTEWASKTPAVLPAVTQWHNPDLKFSLKKVLRQEKNGFAAIFILFFIFDTLAEYIIFGEVHFRNQHWLLLCLVSTAIYLILKVLKNNTNILTPEDGR